jgi:hypothetical protein
LPHHFRLESARPAGANDHEPKQHKQAARVRSCWRHRYGEDSVLRWGQPYESLELDNVIHFITGETLARVSQANPGLLAKDIKKARRARAALA